MMQEDGSKVETPVKITIKDGKKPAEVYRTDLITAMKIPDHQLLTPGTYFDLSDPWKQEWERGVQVPVNKESLPQPSFSISNAAEHSHAEFRMPYKFVKCGKKKENVLQKSPLYDLDDEDVEWLKALNKSRAKNDDEIDELVMEKAIECLENQCYTNMGETISTAKGLSIEYDEDITCDICRSPECEDGNEILFCDVCDVAVHQACYGVQKVPIGSWVCKPCAQQLHHCPCLLCSTRGGAMKKTKTKGVNGWVHMSCALWIPEVGIGNVEKMEPITRIETIPPGRWNLLCYICKEKRGACIQCSVKSCVTAFHVTCGFNNKLHMETVLDDSAPDGVRHVCYCSKHTEKRCGRSPRKSYSSPSTPIKSTLNSSTRTTPSKSSTTSRAKEEKERENLRQNRLRGMEEEFYKYADVDVLADELNITTELAASFHRFWTLKRKAREDAALLSPTAEQQDLLSGRQIKPFQKATMEIERVVRFRQDLERIRNLCYMIERREKMKRELSATREAVFRKQLEVVDDTSGSMSAEDIRWARSCCAKNFTEYEELQEIDLRWPVKPKVYKKRGRKPKRKRRTLTNRFVDIATGSQSNANATERSDECGESDFREQNNDSAFSPSNSIDGHLDNDVATSSGADVPDNCTISCENTCSDNDERLRSSRSKQPKRSNDNGMSSDSDFEDESTRKSKRRASIAHLRLRRSSKLDTDVADVSGSSEAVLTGSLSMKTRGSSPVKSKAGLNGLNVISVHCNLLESKGTVKDNNVRLSPNNAEDGQLKRNRKRLFCELTEKRPEPPSPRILRSNGAVLGVQLTHNVASEKRIRRPNGVVHSSDSDKSRSDSNSLKATENRAESDVRLEVRLTRSRSRTSGSDSPKSSSELSDEPPTTNKLSENASKAGSCGTRSNKDRAVSPSVSSKMNGILCIKKNEEIVVPQLGKEGLPTSVPQLAQESLSNGDEVSDIASRTRSRGHAMKIDPCQIKDSKLSHIFLTCPETQTNCKQGYPTKKAIPERGRLLRRHTKSSDNLGASKATMYNSPTKCSKFFGKLRQAATTSA